MRKLAIVIVLLQFFSSSLSAQVGISTDNSAPDSSAMLEVKSTTSGILIPRMTLDQRNAIARPAPGLMIFCLDCGSNGALSIYSNGAWRTYTPCNTPSSTSGANTLSPGQIIWNWTTVAGALGYKWNTSTSYGTALDLGITTSRTETGISCGITYTRYVWAYNECGSSVPVSLIQTVPASAPASPASGIHGFTQTSVTWNWNTVPDAIGYKWNTADNVTTAADMGTTTTKTETGLSCGMEYTRFVWAYNGCGFSVPVALTQATLPALPVSVEIFASDNHCCGGHSIEFTASPTNGGSSPLYQWKVNSTVFGISEFNTFQYFPENNDTVTCSLISNATCITGNPAISNAIVMTIYPSPPPPPGSATHVPSLNQIVWNWHRVSGVWMYKWNTTPNFMTAMYADTTHTETGLSCGTSYTRYVWAIGPCGDSPSAVLTQSTLDITPPPVSGVHVASGNQIVWNWNTVTGATGYKWNTINVYASAMEMGTSTTKTETGLSCETSYTRFVWAYGNCGVSQQTTLTQSTFGTPASPVSDTHFPSGNQIMWNWYTVPGATGYKWNTTNDSISAIDMGLNTRFTEAGLTCGTSYTRYVWAYNICGISPATALTESTSETEASPDPGLCVPLSTRIEWNWAAVSDAIGYKWNTTDDLGSAVNMGSNTTKTETGLSCETFYLRYVWAYNTCGISAPTQLWQSTSGSPPAPEEGTHIPSVNQIVWNWNTVSDATGYKWNTTDDSQTAIDLGLAVTKTETGLSCGTSYTRYIWANNTCGMSMPTSITQSTLGTVASPEAGTNVSSYTQIEWNWSTVPGATGYKWNTTDDYGSATDMGTSTTKTETSLSCGISYTRYVWAYNTCGESISASLTQSTSGIAPPVSGTHVPSGTQIVWHWNAVSGATGYKWNTIDDYGSATDMGTATSKTETGLTVGANYARYVWSYNATCLDPASTTLNQLLVYLGANYGGGIVFFIDPTNQHGLISATTDQSAAAQWGCYGTLVGASFTDIGMGRPNTSIILRGCSTAGIAARICDDLVLNTYDDWFLPTKDELNRMYLNKTAIGGFVGSTYWSSSENDANTAWLQNFSNGAQTSSSKSTTNRVRAVRSF